MDCPAAAAQVAEAYRDAGLDVETLQSTDRYVRLWVVQPGTDLGCKVEIVADVRFEPPVRMAMGPVLHPDDVAAGKVEALFNRALARGFIDVDALLGSGRYSRRRLLAFVHRRVDQEFSVYGVDAEAVARIRRRFADWEQELRLAP